MKKRKTAGWLIGIPVLIGALILLIMVIEPEKDGISRALAYKATALSVTTAEVCKNQQEAEDSYFSEKEQGKWYTKYMDYLYREGFLTEEMTGADAKTAEGWLTYEEADSIAVHMSDTLSGYVKVNKQNREKRYPKEEWWLLYDEICKAVDEDKTIKSKALVVSGTPLNVDGAPAWTGYTSQGVVGFEGLSLDSYIDKEIRVLMKNQEIIRVTELISEEAVYSNVWILASDGDKVEGYIAGITREFSLKKKDKKQAEMAGNLADLYIKDGVLKKIVLKKDKISGKVLEVKADSIEIEGYGEIPMEEGFRVYQVYGEFREQKKSDILVGYDVHEFVVADGKLCGALTLRPFEADTIRVLLMNTNFKSLFHDSITLKMGSPGIMTLGKKEEKFQAGDTITVSRGDSRLKNGRLILEPDDEAAGITVESIERAQGIPVYPGRLEIKEEEDGLILVNELYLEDYLKRVVPSEMPGSYEKEALKAQAVCARTYAYRQIKGNAYMQYGGHVDDSTRYQVYNNTATEASTDAAVNETYGKLLSYQGNPLEAFYFSTSCGYTTDGTIWGAALSDVPYLQGVALQENGSKLDLTQNDVFASFIKDKNYPSYESGFAMYRWKTEITGRQLEAKISDIGTITEIIMKARGSGGIGERMEVQGSQGSRTITGQGQIRSILGNTELVITKNDGNTVTGWDTIPSAFITVEKGETDGEGVATFHIYGGGYGHGVGMSQNGAQGMAKAGKTYKDILTFFFTGAEITEN